MIKILDGWYFKVDDYQHILIHQYEREKLDFKTKRGTGEFVVKTEEVGYFPSAEEMLEKLRRILIKEKCDAGLIETIGQYIAEMRKINAELVEACNVDER